MDIEKRCPDFSSMIAVEVTSVIRNRVFLNKISSVTGNEAYDAFFSYTDKDVRR